MARYIHEFQKHPVILHSHIIQQKLHDKYSLTFDDRHQKALQESQVHNKCLFCSKMSVIYVQIPSFVSAFGIHIQTLNPVSVTSDKNFKRLYTGRRNISNYVQNQSLGCFYHKSSIKFQPENSFVSTKQRNAGRYHVVCA